MFTSKWTGSGPSETRVSPLRLLAPGLAVEVDIELEADAVVARGLKTEPGCAPVEEVGNPVRDPPVLIPVAELVGAAARESAHPGVQTTGGQIFAAAVVLSEPCRAMRTVREDTGPTRLNSAEIERPAARARTAPPVREGHIIALTDRHRAAIEAPGEAPRGSGWTGSPTSLQSRGTPQRAAGIMEVFYAPVSPAIEAEIET